MLFFYFFDIIIVKELNYWGDVMVEIKKVTNIIDKYRSKYSDFFSNIQDNYLDEKGIIESKYGYNIVDEEKETFCVDKEKIEEFQKNYTKKIVNIFDKIKEENKNEYKFLVTLMYHDYIMLLEYYSDEFTEEEIEQIEELEFNDDIKLIDSFEDLNSYLEGNPDFYFTLMNYLIQFYDLNYYDTRSLYYKNDKNDKYLSKIFPFHIIDKLYFTKLITSNDLIDEFEHEQNVAIHEIVEKLYMLRRFDKKNYGMLIDEMLENFYKNTTYKRSKGIFEDINLNLITLIEKGDMKYLKHNIIDEHNSIICIIQELYNNCKVYDLEYKKEAENYYQNNCQEVRKKFLKK